MIVNGHRIEPFADLRDVNLRGADLDFSCWPLWCGSQGVKLDAAQVDQLCLHLYWVVAPRSRVAVAVKARAKRAARKHNKGRTTWKK